MWRSPSVTLYLVGDGLAGKYVDCVSHTGDYADAIAMEISEPLKVSRSDSKCVAVKNGGGEM
jgi:hypothetical protein